MSETKECECPLRPGDGSGYTYELMVRLRAAWDREHGEHSWAKQRDALAAKVMPRLEEEMRGRGAREWRMLQQMVGALCLLLALTATTARAVPFVDLYARAWDTGTKATAALRLEHKDLVKGEWDNQEKRCAILKVTLGLVDLALQGTSAFSPAFALAELRSLKQFLEADRANTCRPPPDKGVNAGAEFVRAVEARSKATTPTGWALEAPPRPGDAVRGAAALGVGLGAAGEAAAAAPALPLLAVPPLPMRAPAPTGREAL